MIPACKGPFIQTLNDEGSHFILYCPGLRLSNLSCVTSMKSGQMTGFVAPYVHLMQGASPGPVIVSAISLIKFGELIQP
jgi:hypothetical protein